MPSVFYRDLGFEYPVAVRAEGMYLIDESGRRYLDMSGGAAVSTMGHGDRNVINAIKKQLDRLAYAHTTFFTNEAQEELADRIAARFGEPDARIYFSSGGSEANETALKLAWQFWRASKRPDKSVVISRQFSYHGNTLGALSVSGHAGRRGPYAHVLHDWPRIAPCYAYRHKKDGESNEQYGLRAAAELEQAIARLGADRVAAFIAEPVVGATLGAVPAEPGYFREIRRICSAHDVLFIADEIMCGAGRCGSYFAHQSDGIVPDIVTMAKGLGGGYQPLGAVLVRRHIVDTLRASGGFVHGHTYIGHAAACAAGVAIQKCLDETGLLAQVAAKGDELLGFLRDRYAAHPRIGDIRGRGLFAGLEFVADRGTKEAFPVEANIAGKIRTTAMQHGLICYPGSGSVDGRRGAHMLLAPPFIVEAKHIEEMGDRLDAVFEAVFGT